MLERRATTESRPAPCGRIADRDPGVPLKVWTLGWAEVAGLLAAELTVVACDRRGYGQTPPGAGPFSHLDDLLAVIDHAGADPVWLVGASAGGGLALDAALVAPGRVAGLALRRLSWCLTNHRRTRPLPGVDGRTNHPFRREPG